MFAPTAPPLGPAPSYIDRVLRIAVRLPATIDDAGEYLADVTALEAAGVETIWVDDTALDPWIVLGALAAVTHRPRLGCLLTSMVPWPPTALGTRVATLQKLSPGRIVVGLPLPGRKDKHVAALRVAGAKVFTDGSDPKTADGVIFDIDSADQLGGAAQPDKEVWAAIAVPSDREGWARALSAYEAAGATGVIVPWNGRVLDLLRNSEPDDRTDLLISTG